MMTNITTQKAAGAINTNGLHTNTEKPRFRTGNAGKQVPGVRDIATQIVHLTIAGHAVRKTAHGGFLVCKYGMSYHAEDFADLQAFALELGVKQ
jgi:hypothetical protein